MSQAGTLCCIQKNTYLKASCLLSLLPASILQKMLSSAGFQHGGNSLATSHLVVAVNAAGTVDDTSTLSGSEHGNKNAMKLLHEYLCLQQSGCIDKLEKLFIVLSETTNG